jgi:hypothetical protein
MLLTNVYWQFAAQILNVRTCLCLLHDAGGSRLAR